MSGYPANPLEPDVFSSSPSSSRTRHDSLNTTAPAWVSITANGQQSILETLTERSEASTTRIDNGHSHDHNIHAAQAVAPPTMPFSLPATPPHSPDFAEPPLVRLESSLPRGNRPPQLNLRSTPTLKERQGISRSAQQPSFNPVVGSSSNSGTPVRPANPRLSQLKSRQRDFSSLPCTPLRSLDRFSGGNGGVFTANSVEGKFSTSPWTWPPRSASSGIGENGGGGLYDLECVDVGEMDTTPTKTKLGVNMVNRSSAGLAHIQQSSLGQPLATRYVLVQGLDKGSSEDDLRNLLVSRCKGLSLRGCFTSALRSLGIVVLVFCDVRHAVAAVRKLCRGLDENSAISDQSLQLKARCIARDVFEELHVGSPPSPLLSPSEAVLVFTLRGPTSTAFFSPLPLLASFGEVRSLKVVEEHLHVVEYWDDRAAQAAFEVLDGREAGGARFGCSFEPGVASLELEDARVTSAFDYRFASPVPSNVPATPVPPIQHLATPHLEYSLATPSPISPSFLPFQAPFAAPLSPHFEQYPFTPRDVDTTMVSLIGVTSEPPSHFASDPKVRSPNELPSSTDGRNRLAQIHIPNGPATATPALPSPASPAGFGSLHTSPHASASPSSASPRGGNFPFNSHSKGKGKYRSRLSEDFGIVRDDKIPAGNVLNFERIERGLDMRTTLMLKNIPNKLKDLEVMSFIDEVVGRAYDFFYLRCDYSNDCNVGYGFVNFTSTSALLTFTKARLGTRWNVCGSDKLCIMSFANIQGKASLINHFKNSSVLDQEENRRPKLFVSSGPHVGQPEAFPTCDDPIRKARSAMNAQNVGLFPSQKPIFKVTQAFTGMHI
ncbi:hypothetical protein JCM11641_001434 [Rhodosporidiobolus odoratus]